MEEGNKSKKTIFIGNVAEEVNETIIYENFQTFGDIIEVQLPPANTNPHQPPDGKHRGFALVTFGSATDAQDAIDNMDMNEMNGKVLKVNTARPMMTPMQLGGNRAVWESEEWLKQNVKPLAESGGAQNLRRGELEDGKEVTPTADADEAMEE
ncbi:RNA-binding domain-containing protein [Cylindrobasidium torrendii FP15055 ss-10]|uniref:RNA-binding domain-containing protein n=1 Tax=Cylindrobasidium torrendii FP15055 ss-10 TaxID=1314674 RepID=A0A0D7BPK5_9AGAR|nr:RNA-binding domain-containing protein [Cylindrobasidium torrendii FP15055 ss-10]